MRSGHNWDLKWHCKLILRTDQRSFCIYIYTFRGVYIRLYFISDGDSVGGRSCFSQHFRLAPRTVVGQILSGSKTKGPQRFVSSSVTENRTETLGLNRRSAYKLLPYQGGGSRWPTRWIWKTAAIQAAGDHCWLSDKSRTSLGRLGTFSVALGLFSPKPTERISAYWKFTIVTTAIGYQY